jgi:Mycoplasma protein of unknown function, DUF285
MIFEELNKIVDSVNDMKEATGSSTFTEVKDKVERIPVFDSFKSPLAQLGYTPEDEAIYKDLKIDMTTVKEDVEYSKQFEGLKLTYYQARNKFKGDTTLKYLPYIDFSSAETFEGMCCECPNFKSLILRDDETKLITGMHRTFDSSGLELFNYPNLTLPKVTQFLRTFQNCPNLRLVDISGVDFSQITEMTGAFWNCPNLTHIYIKDFGASQSLTLSTTFGNSSKPTPWGTGSEEARQSLIDSLITYSFDRTAAGYSPLNLALSTETKNVLTDEEKAAITAKGFTIV